MEISVQVLISAIGIIGAGVSAWVGVRVALAQVQRDIKALDRADESLGKRLDRLENPYFSPRDRNRE